MQYIAEFVGKVPILQGAISDVLGFDSRIALVIELGHSKSMRDENINNGDLLVVNRSINPKHGYIVVAAVDGDYTAKKLYRRAGVVELRLRILPVMQFALVKEKSF